MSELFLHTQKQVRKFTLIRAKVFDKEGFKGDVSTQTRRVSLLV
jgi:hypothetical protein